MEQWSKTRHRFISAMLLQKCCTSDGALDLFLTIFDQKIHHAYYIIRVGIPALFFFFLRFFFPRRK